MYYVEELCSSCCRTLQANTKYQDTVKALCCSSLQHSHVTPAVTATQQHSEGSCLLCTYVWKTGRRHEPCPISGAQTSQQVNTTELWPLLKVTPVMYVVISNINFLPLVCHWNITTCYCKITNFQGIDEICTNQSVWQRRCLCRMVSAEFN